MPLLELSQSLPVGALIDRDAHLLQGQVAATGGLWFRAGATAVDPPAPTSETALTRWHSTDGARSLLPSEPNGGNTRLGTFGGAPGLILTEGVHCGFWLAGATDLATCFSAAILYTAPKGDARTLLSLSTGQEHNLVFLSDADGQLSLHDRTTGAGMDTVLPMRGGATRLAIISYDGRTLALRTFGRTVQTAANLPAMDRPGEFFVGCRSNRRGLLKTLGQACIHDVFFWPDRAILLEDEHRHAELTETLERYLAWSRQ